MRLGASSMYLGVHVQNSKRIQRALKKLDEIYENFQYYSNGSKHYDKDFKELHELIEELGLEKKKDHARLAKKLKYRWEQDQKDDE